MRYAFNPVLERYSREQIADALGAKRNTVTKRISRGTGLTEAEADRLAAGLNMHPSELWPEWFDATVQKCADCPETFVPSTHNQRFCSARCKGRVTRRNYYRRNPDRARALNRRWSDENKGYVLAQAKRRRVASKEADRKRERYATDPEYRARVLAARRRYLQRQRGEAA